MGFNPATLSCAWWWFRLRGRPHSPVVLFLSCRSVHAASTSVHCVGAVGPSVVTMRLIRWVRIGTDDRGVHRDRTFLTSICDSMLEAAERG